MEFDTNFLIALATMAFTAWAGVVGWIGKGVLDRIDDIRGSVKELDGELKLWIVQTEKRLSSVETKLDLKC